VSGPLPLHRLQKPGMAGARHKSLLTWCLKWGLTPTSVLSVSASHAACITGLVHHPSFAPDVLKTEVSTLHVHFIWVLHILPQCHSNDNTLSHGRFLVVMSGGGRSLGLGAPVIHLECSYGKCSCIFGDMQCLTHVNNMEHLTVLPSIWHAFSLPLASPKPRQYSAA
jgi:hypothetical protein